jgi:hypothetical protein
LDRVGLDRVGLGRANPNPSQPNPSQGKVRINQMQKSKSEQGYFPQVGNNNRFYFQQEGNFLEGFHLINYLNTNLNHYLN